MRLRDYQQKLIDDLYRSWGKGSRNVMLVSPTGSGKTVVMASIAGQMPGPGVAIAHRKELVSQIAMALGRCGILHNIIGAPETIKLCVRSQIGELGKSLYHRNAPVTVASVDTLLSRKNKLTQWAAQQTWWSIDEAHHVLTGNKWGSAIAAMPNALGIGYTATPVRSDRKSLSAAQGGVFDDMVVGPGMRDLIAQGALCDYRIFAPAVSYTLTDADVGSTGDFKRTALVEASKNSQIVGDVVSHYERICPGKRGIVFTTSVAEAARMAQAFSEAGFAAMAISDKTPADVRNNALRKLRDGALKVLVNVDLFGEGLDVPAVEVVSMARSTMSYGLYVQQFGRALRVIDGKPHGIIIDHVGNVARHGLPDAPRQWSLVADERGKRDERDPDVIPVRTCLQCMSVYERLLRACPYCGHTHVPEGRSSPEQVDGDLCELDAATLVAMRDDIDRIIGDPEIPRGASAMVEASVRKRWAERRDAVLNLEREIQMWAGHRRAKGDDDATIYRRFYFRFGTDIMSALAVDRKNADAMAQKVRDDYEK